jgi:hypothetical protein
VHDDNKTKNSGNNIFMNPSIYIHIVNDLLILTIWLLPKFLVHLF